MSVLGRRVVVAACAVLAVAVSAALAAPDPPVPEPGFLTPLGSDVQHLHFKYGPLHVPAGGNLILVGPVTIEKPAYDGFVVGFQPNLVEADGTVPPIEQVHLHHAVWLDLSAKDITAPGVVGQRFAAAGEEKTTMRMPPGYGYPVKGTDVWGLNYMLHNETPIPQTVFVTYDVDYVPASSALGKTLTPVQPLWFDVRNTETYPVFDVHRGTGTGGEITYPHDVPDAYGGGKRLNDWVSDRDGSLVWAAGHLHPGGLHDDLYLDRGGATAHLFRSDAKYFDPNGPVSWDLAMTVTPPDWRVGVRKGDHLRVETTYETQHASWYESMGIVVAWFAPSQAGPDPFAAPPPLTGDVTHGHLPEADNHGGAPQGLPDPSTLADGQTIGDRVGIGAFTYQPGNLGSASYLGLPPVVRRGTPLTFDNEDASAQIFHTITACRAPCTGSTGISYPLADGAGGFDSGELGYGPTGLTAAANRYEWALDTSKLSPGTYTYFCRIHPFMRGAFRVAQ